MTSIYANVDTMQITTFLERPGNGVAAGKTSFISYFDILNALRRRQDFVFVKYQKNNTVTAR